MPDQFDLLMTHGVQAQRQRRNSEAITAFRKAAGLRPDRPDVWFQLGIAYAEARQYQDAVRCLRKTADLDPGKGQIYYNLGLIEQAAGLLREASQSLRKAAELDPKISRVWESLGRVLWEQRRWLESIVCFEKVLELSPNSAHTCLILAIAYEKCGDPQKAIEYGKRAVSLDPNSSKSHAVLGYGFLNNGKFEEAKAEFESSLKIQPEQSDAYLGIVSGKKIKEPDRELIQRIEALVGSPALSNNDRSQLSGVLAKAFDDLQDYEKAIHYADQGSELFQKEVGLQTLLAERRDLDTYINRILSTFDGKYFERAFVGNTSGLPIFIVGLPRSGTTLLEQILSSHSQVDAVGETLFWEGVEASRKNELWDFLDDPAEVAETSEKYLQYLRSRTGQNRFVTDKSNNNGFLAGVLHKTFPNAKIILCKRNPLDNCISLYLTLFREKASLFRTRESIVHYYRLYSQLLDHWERHIPRNRLLTVQYEALVADKERVIKDVLEFCGLEWEEACARHEQNARAIDSTSFWQARQPIYSSSVNRWKHYEQWLGPIADLKGAC